MWNGFTPTVALDMIESLHQINSYLLKGDRRRVTVQVL